MWLILDNIKWIEKKILDKNIDTYIHKSLSTRNNGSILFDDRMRCIPRRGKLSNKNEAMNKKVIKGTMSFEIGIRYC